MTEKILQAAVGSAFAPARPSIEFPTPLDLPQLPRLFRVTSVRNTRIDDHRTEQRVTIFNEAAHLTVCWTVKLPDTRIQPGTLVSPRWPLRLAHRHGAHVVTRLVLLDRPEPHCNLFRTVPHGWVRNRNLIRRAMALCDALPDAYQHLFNAVMWNGDRFRRFCNGPSSKSGHHNGDSGNLEHSIQTAEIVSQDCERFPRSHKGLAILAALLHDAGKADEYELGRDGFWKLTDRGRLLGHRVTILEWISAAFATNHITIPENQRLALLHCLTAAPNAPSWLGIRPPAMFEAIALSAADRITGAADLLARCAPANSEGSGRYHRHLATRPFFVSDSD